MQLTQKIQTNTMDTAMAKSADAWGRAEWARILGLSYGALFNRLKSSKSIEDAFLQQPQHHNRVKKRREALNA